mgnify:CR=1 FL=1
MGYSVAELNDATSEASQNTQLRRAAGQVLCGAAYREDRIAKLLDAGVGLGARRRHLVYKVTCVR